MLVAGRIAADEEGVVGGVAVVITFGVGVTLTGTIGVLKMDDTLRLDGALVMTDVRGVVLVTTLAVETSAVVSRSLAVVASVVEAIREALQNSRMIS